MKNEWLNSGGPLPFEGLGQDAPDDFFAGTYLLGTPELMGRRPQLMGWGFGAEAVTCAAGALPDGAGCKCPEGTQLAFSQALNAYVCAAVPQKDGSFLSTVTAYIDDSAKVLDLLCRTIHWGCPKSATGQVIPYPTGVQNPTPWYQTTGGIVALVLGAGVLGTGIWLVAKKD